MLLGAGIHSSCIGMAPCQYLAALNYNSCWTEVETVYPHTKFSSNHVFHSGLDVCTLATSLSSSTARMHLRFRVQSRASPETADGYNGAPSMPISESLSVIYLMLRHLP